ncbi:CBS domain-containing protein [Clostridium amylolyticum]|uniref:CBS domain-containing protein n=1 Tax=Clostridium amylolyticum TaxID=1121298 RepID=A0A1M6P6P9_9CLOT|nr:CBS domain-containing protein [Clostridium amylolyticum]SHK03593.1 CBS domain-containing protein [Clostridium amylolyticum]
MRVKDVMTNDVASLKPEDSIERAAELMKEFNIGSLPVCEGKKVIGIVTDRDIALRAVAEGKDNRNQTVKDVMSSNPVVIDSQADVKEAAKLMSDNQIRRIPIVEANSLVGMVSLGDIAVEPHLEDNAQDALKDISEPSIPNR